MVRRHNKKKATKKKEEPEEPELTEGQKLQKIFKKYPDAAIFIASRMGYSTPETVRQWARRDSIPTFRRVQLRILLRDYITQKKEGTI